MNIIFPEHIDLIISLLNKHQTFITINLDNYKYKDIFVKYIDNGLLLLSKPNLIVTRKFLKYINAYKNLK